MLLLNRCSIPVIACMICSSLTFAEPSKLTGPEVLKKMDDVMNAPKDQDIKIFMTLTDKNGKQSEREMVSQQKGKDKRIARFLAPADQKGIAFLSLPDDVMYLYLPAFAKTRRIASHIKNTKFAGTDFSYEDMEAKPFSEKYTATLLKTEADAYVLQLDPMKNINTDYSKVIATVRADNFHPTKMDLYDKGGKLFKIMTFDKIEKVNSYWVSMEYTMDDKKENHKTKMIKKDIKFDSNLPDSSFTERNLIK